MQIIKYPDPRLLTSCDAVNEFGEQLNKLLDDMLTTLKTTGGIGLAANQVGVMKRVFIMIPKVGKDEIGKPIEFVNPEIIHRSDLHAGLREGCLSAPDLFYDVQERAHLVTVKAQDRTGKEFVMNLEGINSVCAQHEIDHLNGIFFFSKLNRQSRRDAERKLAKRG
jgi:peptide deformylase